MQFGRTLASLLLAIPLAANAAKLLKVPLSNTFIGNDAKGLGLQERANPNSNVPVKNRISYLAVTLQAGNNQSFPEVLIDTGSGITWVGRQQAYQPGSNTQIINQTFSIGYGAGGASGIVYRDNVIVGEATAGSQIIGAANFSFFDNTPLIDGILGLGPSGSNHDEISGFNTTPTFVETLFAEGKIDKPIFGLYVKAVDVDGVARDAGELTFGGIDESRITGDIAWVPMIPPFNFRWEFNVTSFSFGDIAFTEVAPAYTDCGVLPLEIPFEQYFDILNKYNATISESGPTIGFLVFQVDTTPESLPSFKFTVGGATFAIPPERYLIAKENYPGLNITDNLLYSWITPAGPKAYNFGQKFLESVYSAYDMENNRVGFAHLK